MDITKKTKIIIDTDIGDDIDDVLAVVFALSSKELEVLGITTVFGNAPKRAQIAKSLIKVCNRSDIPIYAGSSDMLNVPIKEEYTPYLYTDNLAKLKYNEGHAIDFMAETIMENPNKVTIVTIGPLTNIALLIKEYPEAESKIKSLIFMGGAFCHHYISWNISCDVDAAKKVFESGIDITAISRDVSLSCVMTEKDIKALGAKNTKSAEYICNMIELWRENAYYTKSTSLPILFDSLAIYAAFGDEFLKFKYEHVLVEDKGRYTKGMTFVVNGEYNKFYNLKNYPHLHDIPSVRIASEVNVKAFMDFHFRRLTGGL